MDYQISMAFENNTLLPELETILEGLEKSWETLNAGINADQLEIMTRRLEKLEEKTELTIEEMMETNAFFEKFSHHMPTLSLLNHSETDEIAWPKTHKILAKNAPLLAAEMALQLQQLSYRAFTAEDGLPELDSPQASEFKLSKQHFKAALDYHNKLLSAYVLTDLRANLHLTCARDTIFKWVYTANECFVLCDYASAHAIAFGLEHIKQYLPETLKIQADLISVVNGVAMLASKIYDHEVEDKIIIPCLSTLKRDLDRSPNNDTKQALNQTILQKYHAAKAANLDTNTSSPWQEILLSHQHCTQFDTHIISRLSQSGNLTHYADILNDASLHELDPNNAMPKFIARIDSIKLLEVLCQNYQTIKHKLQPCHDAIIFNWKKTTPGTEAITYLFSDLGITIDSYTINNIREELVSLAKEKEEDKLMHKEDGLSLAYRDTCFAVQLSKDSKSDTNILLAGKEPVAGR
jgi:hypothetical protein